MTPGTVRDTVTSALLVAILINVNAVGLTIAADYPYPGTVTTATPHQFDTVLKRLEKAIGSKSIEASGKTFIAHTVEGVNLVAWKDKDVLCILAAKLPQETLIQLAERLVSIA